MLGLLKSLHIIFLLHNHLNHINKLAIEKSVSAWILVSYLSKLIEQTAEYSLKTWMYLMLLCHTEFHA
jgi:hypothetical protein